MNLIDRIHWFGQASVKIEAGSRIIYSDPYMIKKQDKADIVLITHSHFDHLSVDDIKKVAATGTRFYAPPDCIAKIKAAGYSNITEVRPGFSEKFDNISIEAVPAYNVVKKNFHPQENNWVGYVIGIDDKRIYLAGDTERIPEMKNIACDIALLPLGQVYTMNSVEEAAEAAKDVKAATAIPIHYGVYEGTKADAMLFRKLLEGQTLVVIK